MGEQSVFFLQYLPIRITLVSLGEARLPDYLGSTLRGVIGQALHCDMDAYNYLYGNNTQGNHQQDIVNPYMIVPSAIGQQCYHAGEELHFEMILLGNAAQYIQQIITALIGIEKLGLGASRYPFKLIKVTHSLDQRVIWKEDSFYAIATRCAVLPYRTLPNVRQLVLRTCTPLRIRRNGALLESVDFPTLIRNITHRIEAITARYGGWSDALEIERIRALSEEISTIREHLEQKNMARYSNRLNRKMDFSGLMGHIHFAGDLTPFVPWLYAAQTLHIGRNTTFGMGRIEVEFL